MRVILLLVFLFIINLTLRAQKTDIGVFFGRFYTNYKFHDDGTGFRNPASSQYSVFPSFVVNKNYPGLLSAEFRVSFIVYQQYIGTRLYGPNFYSIMNGGNFSVSMNYSFIRTGKIECRIKGGLGLGFFPDTYTGEFIELYYADPGYDSISRGDIKRDFTPVFPTLSTGMDISYQIAKRFKLSLAASYQKGFFKITEYDIFYNDGSGNNDQHAKQWGNGDFYGVQLGLRYVLTDKAKTKVGKTKN
jgi:hypothetical protein